MSNVYFTADCHFGHNNICKYRPIAESAEHHHQIIKDRVLSTVNKRDTLWLLGDICFSPDYLHYVQEIADSVQVLRIILGNHDLDAKYFTALSGNIRVNAFTTYKNYWISHCPIHPQELRGRKGNIFGHLHNQAIDDPQYHCVSLEHTDFKPILFKDIVEEMESGAQKTVEWDSKIKTFI